MPPDLAKPPPARCKHHARPGAEQKAGFNAAGEGEGRRMARAVRDEKAAHPATEKRGGASSGGRRQRQATRPGGAHHESWQRGREVAFADLGGAAESCGPLGLVASSVAALGRRPDGDRRWPDPTCLSPDPASPGRPRGRRRRYGRRGWRRRRRAAPVGGTGGWRRRVLLEGRAQYATGAIGRERREMRRKREKEKKKLKKRGAHRHLEFWVWD